MSSSSMYFNSAGSNFDTSGGGSTAWSSTAPATGSPDGAGAVSGALGTGSKSQSLDLYNGSPSIPSGQTVDGLQFDVTAKRVSSTRIINFSGCNIRVNSVAGAPNTSVNGTALTTSFALYTYGGATDLCNIPSVNLTQANINSAVEGTGVTMSLWFAGGGGSSATTAQVDSVDFTVWYSPAASGFRGGLLMMGCGM